VPLPDGGAHCFACRKDPPRYLTIVRSAGIYAGLLKELITRYKFHHKDYLSRPLADILLQAYGHFDELQSVDVVVPVPLHWTRRLVRGYNQSALIAKRLAAAIDKPYEGACLQRVRLTRQQFRLTRVERQQNIAGSILVRPAYAKLLEKKTILLIDDICTTTATLNECARALHAAGATGVCGLTLARD
jgi:ComF family protein